jgi:phosphatidylethanolamine/phosphatidyl-N-methylethanolamine N-methyltransferase
MVFRRISSKHPDMMMTSPAANDSVNHLARDLPNATVEKAYGYWSWIYDAVCGPVFRSAHIAITDAANRIGGHVLEVGIGTGLLLPRYRRDMRVTGIDLSEKMLEKARASLSSMTRTGSRDMPRHVTLEEGDIHTLAHADESYNAIVFPFVLTLVASPEAALDNCRRMLKPGGEILVVSHFQSRAPVLARFEQWLAPRIASLGLRPDFPVSRVEAWAATHDDMELLPVVPVGAFGVYSLLHIRRAMP